MPKLFIHWAGKLKSQQRQFGRSFQSLLLFGLLIVLVHLPLSQADGSDSYKNIAPFILLSIGFFISCLPLSSYFEEDVQDGTLEHIIVHYSIHSYTLALFFNYILFYILPLVSILGMVAFINDFSSDLTLSFLGSYFLSALILLSWGGLTALLTVGHTGNNNLLTPLVLIPLGVPSLLVSQATLQAAINGLPVTSYFLIHIGLALISFGIALALMPYLIRQTF